METMERLLGRMNEEQAASCRAFLKDNAELLLKAPGSTGNHQSWPGGYLDHITEVMRLGEEYYIGLSAFRTFPFALADALFVLFWHDCEKPWRIIGAPGHYRSSFDKSLGHEFQLKKMAEFGADKLLTDEMVNALKYVEGEKDDYTQGQRVMNELAAFCHVCDVTSARIFYDEPKDRRILAEEANE